MEEHNPHLKEVILEIVSNQLSSNNPPETKETLDRLISEGYSKQDAKEYIGAVLSAHIAEILSEEHEFDEPKFIKDLKNLPVLPWEE